MTAELISRALEAAAGAVDLVVAPSGSVDIFDAVLAVARSHRVRAHEDRRDGALSADEYKVRLAAVRGIEDALYPLRRGHVAAANSIRPASTLGGVWPRILEALEREFEGDAEALEALDVALVAIANATQ
jgi:hypothetical protein